MRFGGVKNPSGLQEKQISTKARGGVAMVRKLDVGVPVVSSKVNFQRSYLYSYSTCECDQRAINVERDVSHGKVFVLSLVLSLFPESN